MEIVKKYEQDGMVFEVEVIPFGTCKLDVKATFHDGDMLDYEIRPFFHKYILEVADKNGVGFISPGERYGICFETTDFKSVVEIISDLVKCIPLARLEYKKHMNEIEKMLADISVNMEYNGWKLVE